MVIYHQGLYSQPCTRGLISTEKSSIFILALESWQTKKPEKQITFDNFQYSNPQFFNTFGLTSSIKVLTESFVIGLTFSDFCRKQPIFFINRWNWNPHLTLVFVITQSENFLNLWLWFFPIKSTSKVSIWINYVKDNSFVFDKSFQHPFGRKVFSIILTA